MNGKKHVSYSGILAYRRCRVKSSLLHFFIILQEKQKNCVLFLFVHFCHHFTNSNNEVANESKYGTFEDNIQIHVKSVITMFDSNKMTPNTRLCPMFLRTIDKKL